MSSTNAAGRAISPRKQQIMTVAADQFRARGYHNVGIDDIADELGMTGPALYRHFRGKQALLQALMEAVVDDFVEVYARPYADLDELLTTIATVSVSRRTSIVLWLRESRHLDDAQRMTLARRFANALAPLRDAVAARRPDLGASEVDILLWAVQAVFASPGFRPSSLPTTRVRDLLVGCALAIIDTPGLTRSPATPPPPAEPERRLPRSRHEAVLVAATRQFAVRGYARVSMDDIGAATGMAGPSLYHHFPSKVAILTELLDRCVDSMLLDVDTAFGAAGNADEVLLRLVRSLARRNVEQWELLRVLLDEVVNVPAQERERLQKAEEEYVAEWVALATAPGRSHADADVVVRAVLTMFNVVSRRRASRARPSLTDDLAAIAAAALSVEP